MSYILEALKKSEQERKQGAVPNIQSVHKGSASYDEPDESNSGVAFKLFLLALVFVFIGGAGFLWYERLFPAGKEQQLVQNTLPAEPAALQAGKTTPAIKPAARPEQTRQVQAPTPPKPIVSPEPVKSPKPEPVVQAPKVSPKVVYSDKPLDATPEPVSVQDLEQAVAIAQLPASIRKSLPAITFTGHVYSNTPKRRSVVLNGKKLREGNSLNGELVLIAITPEGAILSYQGRLFKMQALQDWAQ